MNLSKIRFTVGAVSLSIALAVMGNTSSAAPSWSQQPAWASASGEPGPSRKPYAREQSPIAPFTPGSNNISLDVGQVFLMGDLSNNYGNSIGSRLHYTYGVSDIFGFDASFGYSGHADGKFSMTSLLTGLRTNLSWYDKIVPYAVFGLGFYKPSYDIGSPSQPASISPIVFGIHLGPGVTLELTQQLFFGTSLTFHDMFGTQAATPLGTTKDVDGTFTTFYLQAGVTF